VVTTHGSDTSIPFNAGKIDYIRSVSAGVDRIVAVSSRLKNMLLQAQLHVPIDVVLNGFSVQHIYAGENICPIPSVPNSLDKTSVIINQTGNLIDSKKNDITIRAFAELKKKYVNAQLVIVGDGPKREELSQLCQTLGISESVEFKGRITNQEVIQEMKRAHFFVMPSINEGFGIVYLEAMASGCVTIGTENEGIADFIVSRKNGFLTPRNDVDAIERVIEWCIENPSHAGEIAARGQKDALEMTWKKNALQYETIFRSLFI